jgi:hypothetical protein
MAVAEITTIITATVPDLDKRWEGYVCLQKVHNPCFAIKAATHKATAL